jgi:Cytochrome P460
VRAIVVFATAIFAASVGAGRAAPSVVLPPELAAYKAWTALLGAPRPVSQRLWMLCVMPTEAQWAEERAVKGPHAERYVMVYGNTAAVAGLKPGADRFPVGTMIAKEKRLAFTTPTTVAGVAFMVKRADPRFAETGGWEFLYFDALPPPSPPPAGASVRPASSAQDRCAPCHRGARKDYVFGPYPTRE